MVHLLAVAARALDEPSVSALEAPAIRRYSRKRHVSHFIRSDRSSQSNFLASASLSVSATAQSRWLPPLRRPCGGSLPMSDPAAFHENPILNSPYEAPERHWVLDADRQPTNTIAEGRRKVSFVTPIPATRKAGGAGQRRLSLDDAGGAPETGDPQYELIACDARPPSRQANADSVVRERCTASSELATLRSGCGPAPRRAHTFCRRAHIPPGTLLPL